MTAAQSLSDFGLYSVAAVAPELALGDPQQNVRNIQAVLARLSPVDLLLFPELALTGYSCGDLFGQQTLLDAAEEALFVLAAETVDLPAVLVVGLPLRVQSALMNVAAVLAAGKILAIVPKQYLPTNHEFYERRWFRPGGIDEPAEVSIGGTAVPFGIDLLVRHGDAVLGIEICEDFWTPVPPSSFQSIAGANILLNLSASNELIGKADWRTQLITSQSGRCLAGYVYASSGPQESTTDVVFGGHCLIAENGQLLSQSRRVGDGHGGWQGAGWATAQVDLQRLAHDRRTISAFADARRFLPYPFRVVPVPPLRTSVPSSGSHRSEVPTRWTNPRPFVPADDATRTERCAEILEIQVAGLTRRLTQLPSAQPLFIGVSGGLDSTLALLVATLACDQAGLSRQRIHGITMPGFGTSQRTQDNALQLMQNLGTRSEQIDIRPLCLQAFRSLDHSPLAIKIDAETDVESLQAQLRQTPGDANDLVFENIQARLRTFVLMSRGFVLGTGDLSEQALGWSTYNGDHMSMYNVNASIPKTLVQFLVQHAADHLFTGQVRHVLQSIVDTPISPELLPLSASGKIRQSTEQSLGPYELHDFFLYHVVRNGFTPEKILFLARHTKFSEPWDQAFITRTLATFYRRFFANQFKRSCVPDGPKVGTVSLSPRGDWRMPSDAHQGPFLADR